jgi:CO/xanthine dehydrogenase Mo-binding subunit
VKKRGVGYASGWQGANYHFGYPDVSTVDLQLTDDLRYRVGVAAADLGQGIPETTRTIVSKVFGGVPPEQIDFIDPDTAVTPDGGATGASRQTTVTGNATLKACRKLVQLLKMAGSELLDTPLEEITIREGVLQGRNGSAPLAAVVEECKRMGLSLSVRASYQAPPTEPFDDRGQGFVVNQFAYATYVVEVEVDTDTGEVQVLKVSTFIDAGKIVRRKGAEMQVEGGTVMGLGHALTEELKLREGEPETDSLSTYLIPTVYDVPFEITSDFVDEPVPNGELGVKGMAELTLVPIAPAITNAIYDAVGVRLHQLPATPERVLIALAMDE